MTKITLNTSIALVAFRNMWFCFTSQTFPSSGNIQGRSLAFFTDWLTLGQFWRSSPPDSGQFVRSSSGILLGL